MENKYAPFKRNENGIRLHWSIDRLILVNRMGNQELFFEKGQVYFINYFLSRKARHYVLGAIMDIENVKTITNGIVEVVKILAPALLRCIGL